MTGAASGAIAASKALDAVMRQDRGRLLAALISRLRDFQLAEEALQEAAASAIVHWGRAGLPNSPQGWLLRVALRKAIDRIRGAARQSRNAADMARLAVDEADDTEPEMIADERLRLIFTCCHPALEQKSQVALTLRTLCGLTTAEIAANFLDQETTMGQRLSRAKAKIAQAGIPFAVPGPEEWGGRLNAVLSVIYLIFNTGYTQGVQNRRDLCDEAIYQARMVNALRPGDPEILGTLALLLLTHARRRARVDAGGQMVALADQDRALWDRAAIDEGVALLEQAMAHGAPGAYQIKAAIAACHVIGARADWAQIRLLYDRLLVIEPTPVVALNRAVAMAEAGALALALAEVAALEEVLGQYQPFFAAKADFLLRAGEAGAAVTAYDKAIALGHSPEQIGFLTARRSEAKKKAEQKLGQSPTGR